jgi:cyclopropane-fatty-acyl-phospholipid synthase
MIEAVLSSKLAALPVPTALRLPGGRQLGDPQPKLMLEIGDVRLLAWLAGGQIGRLAEAYVEGRLDLKGSMRDLMATAAALLPRDPTAAPQPPVLQWWRARLRHLRSLARHTLQRDAQQVQFHYDLGGRGTDDFYALWLDPRRVYSCAYFSDPQMTLAQAQEAKLDLICRKLALQPGERFLDIGAGWGALLLWAAQHYGVRAHGITLSRHQHAHVNGLIDAQGLRGRVTMELRDYRQVPEDEPFDKIASVGMFEHVGRANLGAYFAKIRRLLRPGGLLMNHGITAGGVRNDRLGAGMGNFIERHIFPGGELLHVSRVMRTLAEAGLEGVDVENLRPHYARTLWAWSDALEAQLQAARARVPEAMVRAYRLYLAGSAMGFERGWIALHQMLATRPSGQLGGGALPGAQSVYPFNRGYMYPA